MVKMIMHGCNGAMSQVTADPAANDKDTGIVTGIDLHQGTGCGYPVFTSLEECSVGVNVIADFAPAKAVDGLLKSGAETGTSVVLCTTGFSQEQLATVKGTSASTAILRSVNTSPGANLLLKLVQDAARVLAGLGFDIEIVEKHHNRKTGTPNDTVIALADSTNGAMGDSYGYVYDKNGKREKRSPKEIGTSAVRGGSIVGEHDMISADRDKVVTLSHTAYSKAIFAKKALEVAKFLAGKGPGLYTMVDAARLWLVAFLCLIP